MRRLLILSLLVALFITLPTHSNAQGSSAELQMENNNENFLFRYPGPPRANANPNCRRDLMDLPLEKGGMYVAVKQVGGNYEFIPLADDMKSYVEDYGTDRLQVWVDWSCMADFLGSSKVPCDVVLLPNLLKTYTFTVKINE